MYILDMPMLEAGDIILTAETSSLSKSVRVGTLSGYSHAILYVGHSSYIHSNGDGVHSDNIQRLIFEKKSHGRVLRLRKSDISPQKVAMAIDFARQQVGKQYSIRDAVSVQISSARREVADTNRQFCSRLVAQAYEAAGIQLVADPKYCSPKEFNKSGLLEVVEGCVRSASEAELEFAASENPLKRQKEITNSIRDKVRALTGRDLQTLEQVAAYLFQEHPEYDAQISAIVRESGYLDMWRTEVNKNPWRYDGEDFVRLPRPLAEKQEQAKFELRSASEQHGLYLLMREQFAQLLLQKRLEYFQLEFELYKNLCEITQRRIDAARYMLEHS